MFKQTLRQHLEHMGLSVSDKILESLGVYYQMLAEWNERMNLTAIIEPQEAALKHFADSAAAVAKGLIPEGARCIDVGTGAGFPGLVIAILRPDVKMVLLDALQKRLSFLDAVAQELGLKNVQTVHGRAEDAAHSMVHRQNYDIALARAVAGLNVLAEYCMPFVRTGGYLIAYKGQPTDEELQDAQFAIQKLGGNLPEVVSADVPALEHSLVLVKKTGGTPKAYPRKAGKPAKEPLK